MTRSARYLILAVLLVVPATYAQISGVTYRRVLLPVVLDGPAPVPGANGSIWETVLLLTNEGSSPAYVNPVWRSLPCSADGCEVPDEILAPRVTVPARIYTTWFSRDAPSRNGVILRIEEKYADSIRASLRVHDVSRQDKAWGSMVPIVPENRFTDALTLLALPGQDQNFRVNVRFYSLNTNIPVQVAVQAFAMNTRFASNPSFEDTPLGTQVITLPKAAAPDWLPHYLQPPDVSPNYFFLSDFTSLTNGAPPPLMRLEIRSVTPGATIWAFATITNNDTQEVTVVAPAEH
jgi:hypothetical protein